MKIRVSIFGLFLASTTDAFVVPTNNAVQQQQPALSVSATPQELPSSQGFVLTKEETNPLIRIGEGQKEKIVNAFGLWCAAASLATGPIWIAAMGIVNMINQKNEEWDPNRAVYDKTGKIWAKTWLTMVNSFPTVSGDVERLKQSIAITGPCLYVANHASWLDIPVLCTVLDPVFKFIAKGELRKVPCIGQQLEGGNHILIDREDRRSQLRTFKEGIAWLKKGVPIMAFPEGMRSSDGRLMEFKKGIFSLAVKANVPIVPITLSNTHAVMPAFSFFPVQSGAGKIHVHIGEAISPEGKTEAELEELVRREFLAHLPLSQMPLAVGETEVPQQKVQVTA